MTWLKICVWSAKEIVFLILSKPLLTFFHIKKNCFHWHNFPSWLRTGLALGRLNNWFEWQGHTAGAVSILGAQAVVPVPGTNTLGANTVCTWAAATHFPLLWPQAQAVQPPAGSLLPFAWWSCLNNGEESYFLYSLRMKWYFTAATLHKDLRLTRRVTGSSLIFKPFLHYRILPNNMQWREWDVSKYFFFNKLKNYDHIPSI